MEPKTVNLPTMNPFMSLHAMAAARGDGLRPEFLRLLDARAVLSHPDVIELHRETGLNQAGPNPVGDLETAPKQSVVRFPGRRSMISRASGRDAPVRGGRHDSALGTDH